MIRDQIAREFYIDDHALLYGLLGKYAEERCGQDGMDALAKGTIQYARERGIRMAKRCLADGRELNMQTYLLYGEWADPRGWTDIQVSGIVPRFLNHVEKCGWNDAWRKYDLLRYGTVYCTYADKNLVKGFSPRESVEIDSLLTHGSPACEFDWLRANFQSDQEFYDLMKQKQAISHYSMKDFLYHTGHILSALRRVYYTELGVADTEAICAQALEDYEAIMGAEKRAALEAEANLDFLAV